MVIYSQMKFFRNRTSVQKCMYKGCHCSKSLERVHQWELIKQIALHSYTVHLLKTMICLSNFPSADPPHPAYWLQIPSCLNEFRVQPALSPLLQ